MNIQGKIIDTETGRPIPSASVVVTDVTGKSLGVGTVAGGDGVFYLNSPLISEGGFVQVSSIGYQTVRAAVRFFIDNNTIDLEPLPEELAPVVVRPGKKSLWILAVIAGLLLLSKLEK